MRFLALSIFFTTVLFSDHCWISSVISCTWLSKSPLMRGMGTTKHSACLLLTTHIGFKLVSWPQYRAFCFPAYWTQPQLRSFSSIRTKSIILRKQSWFIAIWLVCKNYVVIKASGSFLFAVENSTIWNVTQKLHFKNIQYLFGKKSNRKIIDVSNAVQQSLSTEIVKYICTDWFKNR